jgi:uncharacterized protein with PIN domain
MLSIRFYAELNDLVAPERRYRESPVDTGGVLVVKDVIESLGVPHGEVDLVLVNGRSVPFGERLRDGDRVAVYPVFEAFDVAGLSQVRPEPLREPRFVLDGHLGRLAAFLRLLGFDVLWEPQPDDPDLARTSAEQRRILMTRDRGLLKRSQVTHGLLIRSKDPRQQLREVVERLHLRRLARPFTRCLRCNAAIVEVDKAAVEHALPPSVREVQQRIWRCAGCAQLYWMGRHHERMQQVIEGALGPEPRAESPEPT